METGKLLRMRRFFKKGKAVIVPLDHALYSGPVRGIEDPINLVRLVSQSKADGILVTPGILIKVKDAIGNLAVVLRIDGTHTRLGSHLERIELISTIETALKLGVDMVAINVFVGVKNEDILLKKLGLVATACLDWGMPLMAEMIPASVLNYHYGKRIKENLDITEDIELVARLGAEIGADIIKTHYTGDIESFKRIAATATVPIVIAGGPKVSGDEEFIKLVEDISLSGASGICIGRNIWQSQNPVEMLESVCKIIHEER